MRVSATVCLRSSNSSSKVTFFVQYMVPSARVKSFTCGTKLHCSRSKIWFCRNCLPVRIFAQAVFLQNHSLLWMGKRERLLADYSWLKYLKNIEGRSFRDTEGSEFFGSLSFRGTQGSEFFRGLSFLGSEVCVFEV